MVNLSNHRAVGNALLFIPFTLIKKERCHGEFVQSLRFG